MASNPNLSISIPSTNGHIAAKSGDVISISEVELASPSSSSSLSPPLSPSPTYNNGDTDILTINPSSAGNSAPAPRGFFGWVKSLRKDLIAGAGLFTNGYNAMVIGYLRPVLQELYPRLPASVLTNITNAYMVGEIIGMIILGASIDRIGRKWGIVLTTLFLVTGILTVALAGLGRPEAEGAFFTTLMIGRAISGFGAGGEFPVSTTGATEANNSNESDRKHRGLKVALSTDTSLDLGFCTCGVIVLIILAAYHFRTCPSFWRICVGIGAILPVVLLYFRIGLLDNTQFKKHAIKHNVPNWLAIKYSWKRQLGVGISWMCYGSMVVFGVYSATIIEELIPDITLAQSIGWSTFTQVGYVVGSPIGGLLMDKFGRKRVLSCGFLAWAVVSVVMGAALPKLASNFPAFICMYFIFNVMSEIGPGPCMFVTASESFPTPIRGKFLGFMAALGRGGSAAGSYGFLNLKSKFPTGIEGYQIVFFIASGILLLGASSSHFLIPDLENDLEAEDARFERYLVKHGYTPPQNARVGDEEQAIADGDSTVQAPAEAHAAPGSEKV